MLQRHVITGGGGAQICTALHVVTSKHKDAFLFGAYLQKQAFKVMPCSLRCGAHVHLLHPHVVTMAAPNTAFCSPHFPVPLPCSHPIYSPCLGTWPCPLPSSFCYPALSAAHQFTPVCTLSPACPIPSGPSWAAEPPPSEQEQNLPVSLGWKKTAGWCCHGSSHQPQYPVAGPRVQAWDWEGETWAKALPREGWAGRKATTGSRASKGTDYEAALWL